MPGKRRREPPEPGTPDEPHGVRILHADGSVSECTLILDPERDGEGCAWWIAAPPAGVEVRAGDRLTFTRLPAKTGVRLPDGD